MGLGVWDLGCGVVRLGVGVLHSAGFELRVWRGCVLFLPVSFGDGPFRGFDVLAFSVRGLWRMQVVQFWALGFVS